MALQIKVSKVAVMSGADKGLMTVTLRLECWAEGADPATDSPVISRDFSEVHKTQVEGKTTEQLVERTRNALRDAMQAEIDNYKRKEALLNNPLLDAAVADIEKELKG